MIKSIRIRNFKSLRDVTVDLEPITVLVGRGGTGKSNFVNAIAFLRDCLLYKEEAFQKWGGWHAVMCATSAYSLEDRRWPPIEFEIWFSAQGTAGDFVYRISIASVPDGEQRAMQFAAEELIHDGLTLFRLEDDNWTRPPAVAPFPLPAPIALELASGIPEVGLAYLFLTAGIGCYDFRGDVLQGGNNGHSGAPAAGLNDDASNFLECLEDINRNLHEMSAQQEIIAALRRLKPTLRGIQTAVPSKDRAIVSLRAEQSNIDVVFNLSQESEGFRRFLAHLIALNQVPPKVLLTFEEPEKGMYPGALSALAEQIKAFPETSGGQVILTTHSPVLLDHFAPEQIRVVEMENLETKIGPVSSPQLEALREQLETTGELLTVDPARLA